MIDRTGPHRGRAARRFAACVALAGCWPAAVAQADAEIERYAGSLDGLLANSYVIASRDEALLVDAQLTRSDARQVVDLIERTGAPLTTIIVTHAHADHYLGLETVLAAFPRARVFANSRTAVEIARHGERERRHWKQALGEDIADAIVVPDVIQVTRFEAAGLSIQAIELWESESIAPTALFVPDRGWLIAGDVLFAAAHPRIDDAHLQGWRRNLDRLAALPDITTIYPGHGEPGDSGMIDRVRAYLASFENAARDAADADALVDAMKALYPAYRLPFRLRDSAEAALARRR